MAKATKMAVVGLDSGHYVLSQGDAAKVCAILACAQEVHTRSVSTDLGYVKYHAYRGTKSPSIVGLDSHIDGSTELEGTITVRKDGLISKVCCNQWGIECERVTPEPEHAAS